MNVYKIRKIVNRKSIYEPVYGITIPKDIVELAGINTNWSIKITNISGNRQIILTSGCSYTIFKKESKEIDLEQWKN